MIRAAVLGSPISHSLSPLLHNTAYAHLGIKVVMKRLRLTQAVWLSLWRIAMETGLDFP